MILREATDADMDEIGAWTKTQLEAWGHTEVDASADYYRTMIQGRPDYRFWTLWEKGLSALMLTLPIKTDRGPGWDITLFLATQDHPEHQRVLGTLALYATKIGLSEGLKVGTSRIMTPRTKRDDLRTFAVSELGMELVEPDLLEGDLKMMLATMLKRHPEWQI